MKKAQGLSMTTIVIAALALLVLVVLVLIFTGRLNLWGQGMDETNACQNYCKTIGLNAHINLDDDDTGKATCRGDTLKGTVVPAVNGADDTKICCCSSESS